MKRRCCVQLALAAAMCKLPETALLYVEQWCSSITGSTDMPSQAQLNEHYAGAHASTSAIRAPGVKGHTASHNSSTENAAAGMLGSGQSGLKPHEAILWSAYKALGDSDLAHGMPGAPSVRAAAC